MVDELSPLGGSIDHIGKIAVRAISPSATKSVNALNSAAKWSLSCRENCL